MAVGEIHVAFPVVRSEIVLSGAQMVRYASFLQRLLRSGERIRHKPLLSVQLPRRRSEKSAVVFDIGINFGPDGKMIGDCERNLLVNFQSPVPCGCGLLTRLALLENALKLIS